MKNRVKYILLPIVLVVIATVFCFMNKSEKSEVLNWGIVGLSGYESNEAVLKEQEEILNRLLKEKGMNYQIQFKVFSFYNGEDLSEEVEKQVESCDLITMRNQFYFKSLKDSETGENKVEFYSTLVDCVEKGLFEPLDSYMQTDVGEKIKEEIHIEESLLSGQVSGQQWFLPTKFPVLTGDSIMIQKEFYESNQLQVDASVNFAECDELFAKIYELNGENPFLRLSDQRVDYKINGIEVIIPEYLCSVLDMSTAKFQGCLLGIGSEKSSGTDMIVENLLESEYIKELLYAWKRYDEKGYILSDEDAKPLVASEVSYGPEMESAILYDDTEYIILKASEYILNIEKQPATINPFVGIGAESNQKKSAFQALSDLITDADLNKVMQNMTAQGMEPLVYQTGFTKEQEEAYFEVAENAEIFVQSGTFTTFDIPEIGAVNEVYTQYTDKAKDLGASVLNVYFSENGQVTEESIEKALDEWNKKLENAGIGKIIDEINRQYKENEVE